MKYLSVCSGIEAASVAWEPLAWEPLAFSEIEAFPRAVLSHHYPQVPLHGDFTKLRDEPWIAQADILVGGTPCQAFSVAGLRQSLSDDRGNLTLEFVRLADAIDDIRPTGDGCIILWENVPGVLSVEDNAFGCLLAALVGNDTPIVPERNKWSNAGMVVGPKRRAAWRILDAQYFGLAQRRRRVFVVASARGGFDPAEVLFEREGVQRHSAPSREAGQGFAHATASCLTSSGRGVERTGDTRGQDQVVAHPVVMAHVAFHPTQDPICSDDGSTHAMGTGNRNGHATVAVAFSCKDYGADATNDISPTLRSMGHADSHANGGGQVAVGFYTNMGTHGGGVEIEKSPTLNQWAVRRLTPVECERLQGFPDNYTAIPWRKKPASECPDGPRYKALGNSMAVPVIWWIGTRIKQETKHETQKSG
jgi:DNA (cytosine-5)-methyltransferase 1